MPTTFRDAFPDYPESDIPAVFLAAPWRDESWANEACPSFSTALGFKEREAHVYVDYVDVARREYEGGERFSAQVTDDGGAFPAAKGEVLNSDDLSAVLDWVELRRAVLVEITGIDDEVTTLARLFGRDPESYLAPQQLDILTAIKAGLVYREVTDVSHGITVTIRRAPTLDALTAEFATWLEQHQSLKDKGDAMEMLCADISHDERLWLSDFVTRWDAVKDRLDCGADDYGPEFLNGRFVR
jgi:hypothetical protein